MIDQNEQLKNLVNMIIDLKIIQYYNIMDNLEKRICEYCKKPLKKIGKDRKNACNKDKDLYDWEDRKFHKKCYRPANQAYVYCDFASGYKVKGPEHIHRYIK